MVRDFKHIDATVWTWSDRWTRSDRASIGGIVSALLLLLWLPIEAAAQNTLDDSFGGSYSSLRPEQKRLIDDWFVRFSATVKIPVDPAQGYDKIPLSAKTTFNAVTHALMMTRLTDDSGGNLAGSAIELVDKVDGAVGQVLGAGGDQQFRIYVQMKPGAMSLLNQSQEFKHTADNTIYHKGYPTSFRTKGVPSIQISLTSDATRADIDVDYRSSKFPAALVNGHLSASNSDVRVGDNDDRHNTQWAGLQNWWRNLLGLPLLEGQPIRLGGRVFSREPKLKDAKPAEAIFDFLNGWLVEQQPDESIAYVGDEAFACIDVAKQSNADRGMAKFVLLENMLSVNARFGKVASLADASTAVTIAGERVKPLEQGRHAEFALYDVREDLAEEFNCATQSDAAPVSAEAAKSKDFGKYVGAVFRIHAKGQEGSVVATLWRKDRHYWKMISYEIDPEIDRSATPNLAAQQSVAASLVYVDGDKDMIKAVSDFLKLWLVKKDIDKALQYVASECLACARVNRTDTTLAVSSAISSQNEARELLKEGMVKAASAVGAVKRLDEAIIAPQLQPAYMKLVRQRDDRAFVIASIPESMGEEEKCDRRSPDGDLDFHPAAATAYGTYYASGFHLNQGRTDPAVLWIIWGQLNGSWKAISYRVITP